jgi:hypothetical protein
LSSWFSLSLGDAVTAVVPGAAVEDQARAMFAGLGEPPDFAVFRRLDTRASLHCEVTLYFPPAAEPIANRNGARPCARPARAGLELIVGDVRAWAVLFAND